MAKLVSAVVAMSENRVIGRENALPWRLPKDLAHVKAVTMGKPLIMGRRTFQSIGRPLPGRLNIVVTRDPGFQAEGIRVAHGIDEAFRIAESEPGWGDEVIVFGGAEIYRQAMERVGRIHLTEVHATIDGDAVFPELDPTDWVERSREDHPPSEGAPAYSFVVLERRIA